MGYEILLTSLCQGQQGSGDGNDAGQWGGGGFPSPIGGGSACPQGQEVDGCVYISLKTLLDQIFRLQWSEIILH